MDFRHLFRRSNKNRRRKNEETLVIFSVQTGSFDDVVLWFGDLWETTGTANVVFSLPIYPICLDLVDWIRCARYNVCAYELCRMFIRGGRAL